MQANYHTHTFRCAHASGTDEEYIERAIACGMKVLGFSEHAPYDFGGNYKDWWRVQVEDAENYISQLKDLREKYKDKIQIYIGFEMEYYPLYFEDMLNYVRELGAEYLILGQHFIGNQYPDGNSSFADGHNERQLIEYTDCIIEGMKTGKFLYVAHPDVFLYTEDDEIYKREAMRLCRTAKELDIPLEINLFGIFDNRHYPNPIFLEAMGEVGCKVILGMDAHAPERTYDEESLAVAMKLVEEYHLNLIEYLEITKI